MISVFGAYMWIASMDGDALWDMGIKRLQFYDHEHQHAMRHVTITCRRGFNVNDVSNNMQEQADILGLDIARCAQCMQPFIATHLQVLPGPTDP